MKPIHLFSVLLVILALSCKKDQPIDTTPPDDRAANQAPVARAGPDQVTVLPKDSVRLNGEASSDADGNITTYKWAKISGPSSFAVANPGSSNTVVRSLAAGVYTFELMVTDAGGLSAKDTVQVTVGEPFTIGACDGTRPQVGADLIPFGSLSIAREWVAVATAANKIVYAGGYSRPGGHTTVFSRVDIADLTTNTWTTHELSHPRSRAITATWGSKIFMGGGSHNEKPSSIIDIYDAATGAWSTITLPPLPRRGAMDAAAAVGNKVLFVSGTVDNAPPSYAVFTIVDILDITTNTWRTDTLQNRTHLLSEHVMSDGGIAATVVGTKVYFAGNASDWDGFDFGTVSGPINIYDAATDTWAVSQLRDKRGYMGAIAVGTKIYWAGGVNGYSGSWTDVVEIRDAITGTSTFSCLSGKRAQFAAVQKGEQLVFFTSNYAYGYGVTNSLGNQFDIYNLPTNTWTVGRLPVTIHGTTVTVVNNTIYVAGGFINGALSDKVWKLQF